MSQHKTQVYWLYRYVCVILCVHIPLHIVPEYSVYVYAYSQSLGKCLIKRNNLTMALPGSCKKLFFQYWELRVSLGRED